MTYVFRMIRWLLNPLRILSVLFYIGLALGAMNSRWWPKQLMPFRDLGNSVVSGIIRVSTPMIKESTKMVDLATGKVSQAPASSVEKATGKGATLTAASPQPAPQIIIQNPPAEQKEDKSKFLPNLAKNLKAFVSILVLIPSVLGAVFFTYQLYKWYKK